MFRNFFGRKNAGFFIGLVIASGLLKAQNYPVQASVVLNPPYSNLLSHYTADAQALGIQLLHKDFATPETDVYLEFKLEGTGITIQSDPSQPSTETFGLTAGTLLTLNGTDLKELMSPNGLVFQGISKSTFISAGSKLPQGIYEFSFRAMDKNTHLAVSNWGVFRVALFGHLPPIINVPVDGSEVKSSQPQYLNIQFTPRHTVSPSSAGNIWYKVRMVELMPADRNPNEAMKSIQVPLYESLIDQTFLMYGPSEPTLIEGRSYALQVQAVDVNSGDLFENEGYSQVVSFVYGSRCPTPDSFRIQKTPEKGVELTWQAQAQCRAYLMEYREQKKGEWAQEMVFSNLYKNGNLRPGAQYEFRVKGICSESESRPTEILGLRMDTAKSPYEKWTSTSCGKPLPTFNLKNRTPLALLQAGDVIHAADFDIKVLASTGANGRFSGNGWVTLPYTGKIPIPCSFENILLNSDFRLLDGKIQVLRKPLELSNRTYESLSKTWRETFGENWNVYDKKSYAGTATDVTVSGGMVVIQGSLGAQKINAGKNIEITDESGAVWYVSAAGKVSKSEGKKITPSIVGNPNTGEGTPDKIGAGMPKVYFSASAGLGFDGYDIRNRTAGTHYDKLDCKDTAYYAGWKLLKCGVQDSIVATLVPGKKYSFHPDSVHFTHSDGTLISAERRDNSYYLTLTGRMNLYADALWAFVYHGFENYGGPSREIIGKVNLIHVDTRKVHVRLIPVNEQLDAATELESSLNALLGGQGLEYEVSESPVLNVSGYSPANDLVAVNREMLGTAYGSELSKFIVAIEARDPWVANYQGSDTAYMFVLGKSAKGESGFMALNRNYGFLFSQNQGLTAHAVAHETSHGLGNLEHVFDQISQAGYTQNLMDYSAPYALFNRDQWLQLFDRKRFSANQFRLSQDAAKGKLMSWKVYTLQDLGLPTTGELDFVAPDGKIITLLADSIQGLTFAQSYIDPGTYFLSRYAQRANGTLTRFIYGGKNYGSYIYHGNFMGYYRDYLPANGKIEQAYYYRNSSKQRVVYAGFEDSGCQLLIRRGTYSNNNKKDTAIARVHMVSATLIKQLALGEACLEYFDASALTPAAKRWWERAQINSNFKGNEDACKRIVRLINDLGDNYKYFDLEAYRKVLAEIKPKNPPPFSDPLEPFSKSELRGFENYLRASYYIIIDQESVLGNIASAQELGQVLETLPLEIQESLSLTTRMKLLRRLVGARLTNDYFLWGLADARMSDNETVVLNLLATTPDNQISDLLDSLTVPIAVNGHVHLLAALSANIDGLDGDEYYRFASLALKWISQKRPPDPNFGMVEATDQTKILQFHSGLFTGTVDYDFLEDGSIRLELQRILRTTKARMVAAPFDWVYIKFYSDFEFGEHTFKEYQTLRLPVFFVTALFNLENLNKYKIVGQLAFDGALFLVGVGEVRALLAAPNTLRKAWLVSKSLLDLGFSLGDITLTAGLGEELNKTPQGQQFLDQWNTIQLYYGIGSLAETGLSTVVYKLYDNYRELKMWKQLDANAEKELDEMVLGIEKTTGLKRLENLLARAGKKIVGEKNLLDIDIPVGHFRKLRTLGDNGEIVVHTARDFWLEEGKEFVQFIDENGKYIIKHDPKTGRMILANAETREVEYFSIDQGGLFGKLHPAQDDQAYKVLMQKTLGHLGLGGLQNVSIRGFNLTFSQEKANVVFGKYKARYLPGIEEQTLGTEEVMDELLMFKHFSYKTQDYELKPGSVVILNVPDGDIAKGKELQERVGDFWESYNRDFLDMTVENKSRVNVVLVSDPRKEEVLKRTIKLKSVDIITPTIYARELKYLINNGIEDLSLLGNQQIEIYKLELKFFNE